MAFKLSGWSAFTKATDKKSHRIEVTPGKDDAKYYDDKGKDISKDFNKPKSKGLDSDWEFMVTPDESINRRYPKSQKKDKSPMKKRTYAQAKAYDKKLDEYIRNRKKYKAGSTEYEDLQAKINAAYDTKRSEKMKASQIKRHKDDPSRTGDQKKKKDTGGYIPQTVSRKDISTDYDPASRNKRKEYIPISQRK